MTDQAPQERSRFTRLMFPDGQEPDPRFTLANERTFLAWVHTSLALLGGGIALEAFAQDLPVQLRHAAALLLVATSLVISVSAVLRWRNVELAMRRDRALPAPAMTMVLAGGLTIASLVLLAVLLSMGG